MSTLVFLEHSGGEIQKGSLEVLSKAAQLGGAVAVALIGSDVGALAAAAGEYGAHTAYVADDLRLAAPLPQPRVDVLARIVREHGIENVFLGQSVLAADVASALAARLEAGLNWQLSDAAFDDGELIGKQPVLGDSVICDVGWCSAVRIALFRSGVFDAVRSGGAAQVVAVEPHFEDFSLAAQMLEQENEPASGPSIEDADVIIAGGRGLGRPENFSLCEDLATALGGAVAATRPVVDAGWYRHSAQVGQTGKTVAPSLYIALGISGAVQHRVGMQSARAIVAVNTDPRAPIFDVCDLGVVGNLHQIAPKLTQLIIARKAAAGGDG